MPASPQEAGGEPRMAMKEVLLQYRTYRGSKACHFGRMRIPESSGPLPVVVYLHGGFWKDKFGKKEMDKLGLQFRPTCTQV